MSLGRGGVERGDGAGLEDDGLVLRGDGGVGLFELGPAFGKLGTEVGEFGTDLGEGILGYVRRFLVIVLSKKQFGKVEYVVGERLASRFNQVNVGFRDAKPLAEIGLGQPKDRPDFVKPVSFFCHKRFFVLTV